MEEGEFYVVGKPELRMIYAGIISSSDGNTFRLKGAVALSNAVLELHRKDGESTFDAARRYWENNIERHKGDLESFSLDNMVRHTA